MPINNIDHINKLEQQQEALPEGFEIKIVKKEEEK
jgi:hypothetical protein